MRMRTRGELGDDTEEKDEKESDHLYHVDEEETCGTDYHCKVAKDEKGGWVARGRDIYFDLGLRWDI